MEKTSWKLARRLFDGIREDMTFGGSKPRLKPGGRYTEPQLEVDSREYPWSFGGVYLESRHTPGGV